MARAIRTTFVAAPPLSALFQVPSQQTTSRRANLFDWPGSVSGIWPAPHRLGWRRDYIREPEYASSVTITLAAQMGWVAFHALCVLTALPSMGLILVLLRPYPPRV